jgi:hypothetical protein
MYPEHSRDLFENGDRRIFQLSFEAAHVGSVNASIVAKALLG